jgi:Domain of unknown function (DUF6891)
VGAGGGEVLGRSGEPGRDPAQVAARVDECLQVDGVAVVFAAVVEPAAEAVDRDAGAVEDRVLVPGPGQPPRRSGQGWGQRREEGDGFLDVALGGGDGRPETTASIGHEVVVALTSVGLPVRWDGDPGKEIDIEPLDWRKRLIAGWARPVLAAPRAVTSRRSSRRRRDRSSRWGRYRSSTVAQVSATPWLNPQLTSGDLIPGLRAAA